MDTGQQAKNDLDLSLSRKNKNEEDLFLISTGNSNQSNDSSTYSGVRIETPKSERGLYNSTDEYTKVDLMFPELSKQMAGGYNDLELLPNNEYTSPKRSFQQGSSLLSLREISRPSTVDTLSSFTRTQNSKLKRCWDYKFDNEESKEDVTFVSPLASASRVDISQEKKDGKGIENGTIYEEIHNMIDAIKGKKTTEVNQISQNKKELQNTSALDQGKNRKRYHKEVSEILNTWYNDAETSNHKEKDNTIKDRAEKTKSQKKKKDTGFEASLQRKKDGKMSVRTRVEQRINLLKANQDEFDKLEAEICLYEQKNRAMQQETRKVGNNIVAKNKRILAQNYVELKNKHMKEENDEREKRIRDAKERRKELEFAHLKHKQAIALRLEDKQAKVEEKRQKMAEMIESQELMIKWSFLTVLMSRYNRWLDTLNKARIIREEKEKRKRFEELVFTRMMPIIWVRRSKKWRTSWDVFKKFFKFYRLWIGIKRKKEAAMIIRSFLSDANMSLQLTRQVHLFRQRVIEVQRMIKSWWTSRQARLQVSLLQYSIVEAKLSLEIPLKGEVANQNTNMDEQEGKGVKGRNKGKTKGSKTLISPISDEKSNRAMLNLGGEEERKKGVTFAEEQTFSDDPVMEKIPIRATHEIKEQLIETEIKKRKEDFCTAQAEYRVAIKQYEHKMQTLQWYQKAGSIMQLGSAAIAQQRKGSIDMTASHNVIIGTLQDEIKRPKEPYMKIILSEIEMRSIVLAGFEKVKLEVKGTSWEQHEFKVNYSIDKILEFCGDTVREQWKPLLTLSPGAQKSIKCNIAANSVTNVKDDGNNAAANVKKGKKSAKSKVTR